MSEELRQAYFKIEELENDLDDAPEEWLVTFSDMVTLMLCVFVLLFAMSSLDVSQKKSTTQIEELKKIFKMKEIDLKKIAHHLNLGQKKGLFNYEFTDKGIEITFSDSLTESSFKSGQAKFTDSFRKKLIDFGKLGVYQAARKLTIEGFTDAAKINPKRNKKFSNNWELSAARAAAVATFIMDKYKVDGSKLKVEGHSFYKNKDNSKIHNPKNRKVKLFFEKYE